jgi:hypothetical protein
MQNTLDQITADARKALGDNLVALILYGSHARGEAHSSSDINLFIVVKDSHAAKLAPLTGVVPDWMKKGAASPVVFAEDQLQRSGDTFALELAEMACSHRVLDGRDPFAGYSPDWEAVRNELEHELRQKTIYLKRRWFAAGGNEKANRAILADTVSGYLTLLRGALMLHRKTVSPLTVSTVLDELKTLPWFKADIWKQLHAVVRGTEKPSSAETTGLLVEYIEQARAFVRYIDQTPGA